MTQEQKIKFVVEKLEITADPTSLACLPWQMFGTIWEYMEERDDFRSFLVWFSATRIVGGEEE